MSALRGWKRLTLSGPSASARRGRHLRSTAFGLFAAALLSGAAQAQSPTGTAAEPAQSDLSVSLGGSMWSGDFGAPSDTLITSVLLGVRYRLKGLRLTANIPRMRIRSDGTVFTGIGGAPLFTAPMINRANRVRDGIGDLTLGAAYLLPESTGLGFDLELLGRVKLPTASQSSQLSTGKADYSAGVVASKTLGRLTPSVSVTYRWFGDTDTWNFRNGVEISAGASYAVTNRTVVLFNYEYARAVTPLIDDYHELVAGVSAPVASDRLRLTAFVGKGLSNGAADVSGGVSLSLKL